MNSKTEFQDKHETSSTTRLEQADSPKPTKRLTLANLAEQYLRHLEEIGKSHGTLFSYGMEMRVACAELGEKTKLTALTPKKVGVFYESDRVTKLKSGKPKSQLSIDKTRRVLRLALVWAVEQGWIEKAPIPEAEKPAKKPAK